MIRNSGLLGLFKTVSTSSASGVHDIFDVYNYRKNSYWPSTVTGYTLTAGTKAPVFGSTGGTYPPSGWTGLQNASADDAFVSGTIPTFTINNTNYTTAYIGSNTYITFGSGAVDYIGLSGSVPSLNKIHLGAADNSYQRVSTFSSASFSRFRYEGTATTSGTVGSPNIVYEATFFNQSLTSNVPAVEILVGSHGRTTGAVGIASSASYYTTFSISANQSYVLIGNASGTVWTVYTGYFFSGTGY